MAITNRRTLKEYFAKGKKPDSSQFADLIDSMTNIVDDGFNKSPEKGMLLSPLNEEGAVLEIRKNILGEGSSWIISLGAAEELLIYKDDTENPYIKLQKNGKIEIGSKDKNLNVEINGNVTARNFTGDSLQGKALANGFWHPVGEMEYGCRAYHIMAACGLKNKGKYAVTEVTAMHVFGNRRRIYSKNSWFGSRFNKIQLRWVRNQENKCGLQIRTRSDYGENVWIHYRIKSLLDMDFIS